MLEHVNHPFICNLRYSFQDIEYMCVCNPVWLAWGSRIPIIPAIVLTLPEVPGC